MVRQFDEFDVPVSVFYKARRQRRSHKLYSFKKPTAAMYARDERERLKRNRSKKP